MPLPKIYIIFCKAYQVLNRRSHELLHAVYATPPSVLSTDAVNFKLIYKLILMLFNFNSNFDIFFFKCFLILILILIFNFNFNFNF